MKISEYRKPNLQDISASKDIVPAALERNARRKELIGVDHISPLASLGMLGDIACLGLFTLGSNVNENPGDLLKNLLINTGAFTFFKLPMYLHVLFLIRETREKVSSITEMTRHQVAYSLEQKIAPETSRSIIVFSAISTVMHRKLLAIKIIDTNSHTTDMLLMISILVLVELVLFLLRNSCRSQLLDYLDISKRN